MFTNLLKNLSILKKFLLINLIFFTIIGLFTFIYLKNVQPNQILENFYFLQGFYFKILIE